MGVMNTSCSIQDLQDELERFSSTDQRAGQAENSLRTSVLIAALVVSR